MQYRYCGLVETKEGEASNEKIDMVGEDYVEFMRLIFGYSDLMTLDIRNKNFKYYDELQRFRITDLKSARIISPICNIPTYSIEVFQVCPELLELIFKISDSMFKLVDGDNKSLEPSFFRANGTLLMMSLIDDDGDVVICPREGENYDQIISKKHWRKETLWEFISSKSKKASNGEGKNASNSDPHILQNN